MDRLLETLLASSDADDQSPNDVMAAKKIADRIHDLDAILVELDCVTANEERGLSSTLRHMVPTSYFLSFLFVEVSVENLLFYLEVEHYKREIASKNDTSRWLEAASALYREYIQQGAPLEINIISSVRSAIQATITPEALQAGYEPLVTVFDDAYRACFALMLDTWKRYLTSEKHQKAMTRLKGANLSDTKVKKAAIREVLYNFVEPRSVADETYVLTREKTMAYFRRCNVYNNRELDPDVILQRFAEDTPRLVRATREFLPGAYDDDKLPLRPGDLVLVLDPHHSGTWKGRCGQRVGLFPANFAEPITNPTFDASDMAHAIDPAHEDDPFQSLLPRIFRSLVRSACQIIATASPPVASWILDGITGTVIAVSQIVGLADSISSRIHQHRDLRIMQHASRQVVEHLKSLGDVLRKAFVSSDTMLRKSNPNYLSLSAVAQLLNIVTDVLQATKELAFATRPVIQSFAATPGEFNMSQLLKLLSDRAVYLEPRKSLEHSQSMLHVATEQVKSSIEAMEDLSYYLRSSLLLYDTSLQYIESASTVQLDDREISIVDSMVSSLLFNIHGTRDATQALLADFSNKAVVRDMMNRAGKLIQQTDRAVATCTVELSKSFDVAEIAQPNRGDQLAGSVPVDALVKEMVSSISTFLGALQQHRKAEFIELANGVRNAAAKLVNKVHFDLTSKGIAGIKRFEEIINDGRDLANRPATAPTIAELLPEQYDDPNTAYQAHRKELIANILGVIPKPETAGSGSQQQALSKSLAALRAIRTLSLSLSDRVASESLRKNLTRAAASLASAADNVEVATRDCSGLIVPEDAIATLKRTCAEALKETKDIEMLISTAVDALSGQQLIGSAMPAAASAAPPPDVSSDLAALAGSLNIASAAPQTNIAPSQSASFIGRKPMSPFDKPTSPFDTSGGAAAPASPFDTGNAPMSPFDTRRATVLAEKRTSVAPNRSRISTVIPSSRRTEETVDPLKAELNACMSVIYESVGKLRLSASLAAGVWPPPNIEAEIRASCAAVAKAVKDAYAAFEKLATGERDRKEKEMAAIFARWKATRIDIHSIICATTQELVNVLVTRQNVDAEERRKHQQARQAKQRTPSKEWIEKAANTDYERWYKGLCTEEILEDQFPDVVFDTSDPKRPNAIRSGSLEGIVRSLCNHKSFDSELLPAVILTYRTFTTPSDFFNVLVERYNDAPPEALSHPKQVEYYYAKKVVFVRTRVSNVLKSWLETSFSDFTENNNDLLKQLQEFLDTQMAVTDANLAQLLNKNIAKMQTESKRSISFTFKTEPPPPMTDKWVGMSTPLLDIHPTEIARQLTLMDFKIFSAIGPHEFLKQAWSKEALKERAPNIRALIKRSNDLTYFTATEILRTEDLATRQAVLLHFIQVAERCLDLNNFNSTLAIYAGLSSSPIHRLKKTWEALNAKNNAAVRAAWQRLEALTDNANNHSAYRTALHKVNPPCVPFLGLYLTDLVFLDDGNADNVQVNEQMLINFDKRFKTFAVIREIQQFQQTPFCLRDWPDLINYLLRNDHFYDDAAMYKQSLHVEPRAAS